MPVSLPNARRDFVAISPICTCGRTAGSCKSRNRPVDEWLCRVCFCFFPSFVIFVRKVLDKFTDIFLFSLQLPRLPTPRPLPLRWSPSKLLMLLPAMLHRTPTWSLLALATSVDTFTPLPDLVFWPLWSFTSPLLWLTSKFAARLGRYFGLSLWSDLVEVLEKGFVANFYCLSNYDYHRLWLLWVGIKFLRMLCCAFSIMFVLVPDILRERI